MAKLSVKKALSQASFHAKKGELMEAERLYQSVLRDFPENKQAQQGLNALRHSSREIALQNPPSDMIALLADLYNRGQFIAAVAYAETLIKLYPEAFAVWNILGAANDELGKVSEACEAFRKATILNPRSADCFNNLGVTLKAQGRLEEAITALVKAITLKPDHAEAHNNLGNALFDQNKLEDAMRAYKKTLALVPDHAGAHNNLGNIERKQGRHVEAGEYYVKALSLYPELS